MERQDQELKPFHADWAKFMAIPQTLHNILRRFGRFVKVERLGELEGNPSDLKRQPSTEFIIRMKVKTSKESKSGTTDSVLEATMSALEEYTPRLKDKIQLNSVSYTINKITPSYYVDELVAYKLEGSA